MCIRDRSSHERPSPVRQCHQDRGGAEVKIGAVGVRAIRLVGQPTRNGIGIPGGHLPGPEKLARVQIECQESVTRVRGRITVVVSCCDVEDVLFRIDRGEMCIRDRGYRYQGMLMTMMR